MLLISPSGFHQSCPSPNFVILRVSVNEEKEILCLGQQLRRSEPAVNQMMRKKLRGRGGVFHAIAN